MEFLKSRCAQFAFAALILVNFTPGVSCYAQNQQKELSEKCLIVSDIHFSPIYAAAKDSALKKRLAAESFEEWKAYFEATPAQADINSSLLFKDANYGILKSALVNMKAKLPNPAFIIIAGDFIWHNATPADSVLKKKSIQFITRLFKEYFPHSTIIPTMGNNDTYGNDYDNQDSRFLTDFATAWQPNLPARAADELKAHGYYSYTTGKLKFLVLNSAVLNYGSNYPQAKTMLGWLHANLSSSNGKKVWIIMHIPPGLNGYNSSNFWNPGYTQAFVDEVTRYSAVVQFSVASHTHFNDFKVFYNATDEPVSFMRIVPSVCANHGNNPSFEVAAFNPHTGKVLHETNYYLNLAGISKDKSVRSAAWDSTLSLPESLGLDKIDARELSGFFKNTEKDTSNRLLCKYTHFYNVGTSTDNPKTVNRPVFLKYLQTDSLKAN